MTMRSATLYLVCLILGLPTSGRLQSDLSVLSSSAASCPLRREALVRGPDAEAPEGGGFYAARAHGIHGAVDLNGTLGEAVLAIAPGRVVVATPTTDWGKLGHTVIIDHLEGGYTVYGHLENVIVNVQTSVSAGQQIGTMGYSGNASGLRTKN